MSFYYAGGIDITFVDEARNVSANTWRDWHIVPESRPLVAPPAVKTEYVDIPGADGSLDYTEALAGLRYKNREGSWSFLVMNGYQNWNVLYNQILRFLHGKRMKIMLDSDPGYYYHGRLFVDSWESKPNNSRIVIKYNIDPWKYPLNTTAELDWQWNELFNLVIFYGKFDVDSDKARTLVNPTNKAIIPSFTCTGPMSIEFAGQTVDLPIGTTSDERLTLQPGDNRMIFNGIGRVIVDYDTGRIL